MVYNSPTALFILQVSCDETNLNRSALKSGVLQLLSGTLAGFYTGLFYEVKIT